MALSLDSEMERGAALLHRGIGAQKVLHIGDSARFLIMSDLAGGCERMLKVAFVLAHEQQGLSRPTTKQLQHEIRHGLLKLVDAVASLYPASFLRIPDARWAQNYLRIDSNFRSSLEILNIFAGSGRYYHMDIIGGKQIDDQSPEQQWSAFETKIGDIVFPDPKDRHARMVSSDNELYYAPVNFQIARIFELFGYALFRLFASGLPDTEANMWSVKWTRFLSTRPSWPDIQRLMPDQI